MSLNMIKVRLCNPSLNRRLNTVEIFYHMFPITYHIDSYSSEDQPLMSSHDQDKLDRGVYDKMSLMESDLRRMVGNAKSYNQKSSEIFSDAEKMRKTIVAFMTVNNPAYKSKDYVPGPTPIPDGWQDRLVENEEVEQEVAEADADGETDHEDTPVTPPVEQPSKLRRRAAPAVATTSKPPNSRRASSTPALQDAEGAGESFEGDTFQQAQEKLMTEMIQLKNDKSVSHCPEISIVTDIR